MVHDYSNIGATSSSPSQPAAPKPGVWTWYVVYCVFLALIYFALMGAGLAILFLVEPKPSDDIAKNITGFFMLAAGLVFFIPFAAAPFLPNKPWVWIYGIVMIAFGMTSACTLPASIAILIFWMKPETKKYFGRE